MSKCLRERNFIASKSELAGQKCAVQKEKMNQCSVISKSAAV